MLFNRLLHVLLWIAAQSMLAQATFRLPRDSAGQQIPIVDEHARPLTLTTTTTRTRTEIQLVTKTMTRQHAAAATPTPDTVRTEEDEECQLRYGLR